MLSQTTDSKRKGGKPMFNISTGQTTKTRQHFICNTNALIEIT